MKKRILTLLLATTLALTMFTACGGNTSNDNSEKDDVIVEAGDSTTEDNTTEDKETGKNKLDPNKEYVVARNWTKESGMLKTDKKYTYTYNENGQMETKTYYFDGSLCWTKTFEYNEHGDVIFEDTDAGYNSSKREYFYEYDTNGNMTWKQEKQANVDNIIRTDTWKYDSNNNLIEHYTEDNTKWSGKHIYKYDDNGNMIEEVIYEQGYYHRTIYYEYENNVLIKHKVDYDGGNWEEFTYNYNDEGQLESVVMYHNLGGKDNPDGYCGKTEYKYHDNGVIKKELEYSYNEKLVTTTEYDEAGNKIYWKQGTNEENWEYILKPGQ